MELTHILVVSDMQKSKSFYTQVLGADIYREYGGDSCVFTFLGNWLLLVTGGDPTKDKPETIFEAPIDQHSVSHSMTIRVPDCQEAYRILKSRGAQFITPPVNWEHIQSGDCINLHHLREGMEPEATYALVKNIQYGGYSHGPAPWQIGG